MRVNSFFYNTAARYWKLCTRLRFVPFGVFRIIKIITFNFFLVVKITQPKTGKSFSTTVLEVPNLLIIFHLSYLIGI